MLLIPQPAVAVHLGIGHWEFITTDLFILVRACRTALTFLFASIKIHIPKRHSVFNRQLEWRGVYIVAWQIVWVAELFSVLWYV